MIQNSTKNYIKQFNIYKTDPQKSLTVLGNILEQHEQWRRVFPRATATGGAWTNRNRGVWTDFFFCVFLNRRWPAEQEKKCTQQLILVFISFVFEICFGFFSSSFRSAPLLCLLPSLFQAGRFVMGLSSMAVQLLMAGLCRGELVGGGRCAAVVRSAGFVVDGDGEIGGR